MKPILFNTEMVRAILDGRKTVTRRVALPAKNLQPFQGGNYPEGCWWFRGRVYKTWDDAMRSPQGVMSLCRYRPGDILYVRETWQFLPCISCSEPDPCGLVPSRHEDSEVIEEGCWLYKADYHWPERLRWRPSVHMPKEAARIFLWVTGVRVERLQDITEEQAEEEGAPKAFEYNSPEGPMIILNEDGYFIPGFKAAWDSTIKKADLPRYGWDANPWVWVVEFARISKEETQKGGDGNERYFSLPRI